MTTLTALDRRQPWLLPTLIFGGVLAVYLRTMSPTVFGLDSAELSLAAFKLGIVHAPGYPVYLMLAHLFTYLPIGDIGFTVNLFSVLCGAALVASLVLLLRILLVDWRQAAAAALAFAFIYYQWTVSLVAEVYALQGLLFAWILIGALRWRKSGSERYLTLSVLLAGLTAANNPATLLWWPGLLLLLFHRTGVQIRLRQRILLLGVLSIGLLPLLYLPLRSAANPGFVYAGRYDLLGVFYPLDLTNPSNLLWYLSGGQFGRLFPALELQIWLEQALLVFRQFWSAFLGVGVPLGLWGLWRLRRKDPQLFSKLGWVILPYLVFFTGYQAPDNEFMFLPVYVLWTLALGLGFEALYESIGGRWGGLSFLLPLVLLVVNLPYVDTSKTTHIRDIGITRLESVEHGSYYLANWGDASVMQYLQQIDEIRPDVRVINVFFIDKKDLLNLVQKALNNQYNVYLSRRDILPGGEADLKPVGHGYRVVAGEKVE